MMNANEIVNGLADMLSEQKIISKVPGRRNWLIATAVVDGQLIIRYAGTRKNAPWYIEKCFLRNISKYSLRWYDFTYKKDFESAVALLKDLGAIEKAFYVE